LTRCLTILFLLLPCQAFAQVLQERLDQMEAFVNDIVSTETPDYAPELIATIIVDLAPDHKTSSPLKNRVYYQIARLYGDTPKSALTRAATRLRLVQMLSKRISTERAAELYAHYAFYGMGCFGAETAIRGLFGLSPDRAQAIHWVALGVLTVAPSYYLRRPERWQTRIDRTVDSLESAQFLDAETIAILRSSGLPARKGRNCNTQ